MVFLNTSRAFMAGSIELRSLVFCESVRMARVDVLGPPGRGGKLDEITLLSYRKDANYAQQVCPLRNNFSTLLALGERKTPAPADGEAPAGTGPVQLALG